MYRSVTAFVILCSFANTESQNVSCLSSRCSNDEKPIFRIGHTYVYNYSIKIETTKFELKNNAVFDAVVEIHADESCNLILQLYNSTYVSSDNDDNYNNIVEALTKEQLIFQYIDGQITKVCSSSSEPAWVTNIKLGILSALQYTLKNSSDTYNENQLNINGYCDTNYTVSKIDGYKIIRRYTDLNKCEQRTTFEKKKMNLFDEHDMINELSKSIQKCRHVLGINGEPILITCREKHTFKLFKYLNKDVEVDSLSIKQQLDLDRVVIKNDPIVDDNYTSNEYQYDFMLNENEAIIDNIEDIIKFIVLYTTDYRREYKNPNEYVIFINSLKSLSYDQLKEVLINCKPQEKRFLFDSLAKNLNMNFLKFISDFQQIESISDEKISSYFQYLLNIEEPSIEIFDIIEKIINNMQLPQIPNLTVSILVRYYCKMNTNCLETAQIKNLIKRFESSLFTSVNAENSNEILLALSSLGNIGFSHKTDLITSIFMNETLPRLFRIAAIKSLKKMPCEIIKVDELIYFFTDQKYNSMLRIEALLAIAKCLSQNELEQILSTVSEDDDNDYLVKMYIEKNLKFNGLFDLEIESNSTEENESFDTNYDENIQNSANNASSAFTMEKDTNMIRLFGSSRLDISGDKINIIQIDTLYDTSEKKLDEKCLNLESLNSKENEISDTDSGDNYVYIFMSFLENDVHFLNISFSQIYEYFKKPTVGMKYKLKAVDATYVFSTMTGLPITFSVNGNLGVDLNKKEEIEDLSFCKFDPFRNIDINAWIDIDCSISLQSFKERIKIDFGQFIDFPYYK